MQCTPVSVSLEVCLPDHRKVVLELDKTCNRNDTAEWKLRFELQEKNASGEMAAVVKLVVDINPQDHATADATAANGLDAGQRAQAAIAADTARAVAAGGATRADLAQDAAAIIQARQPESNS